MNTDFFKKIKMEDLTQEEKAEGLLNLKNFMVSHPVQQKMFNKNLTTGLFYSPWFTRNRIAVGGVFAVIVFFAGSGVILAANSALPGDLLYPIKIHVNEKVESVTAIGQKKKTEVIVKQAITRLDEAEKLSSEHRLTEDSKKTINAVFSTQLKEGSENIDRLKKTGKEREAVEIDFVLKEALSKHHLILSELSQDEQEEGKEKTKQEEKNTKTRGKINREAGFDVEIKATTIESVTKEATTTTESRVEFGTTTTREETTKDASDENKSGDNRNPLEVKSIIPEIKIPHIKEI